MIATAWSPDVARQLLASIDGPGPVLRGLQAVQARFGYVPDAAVPLIAETFNVSRADVYGVLTFYRDLRSTPPAELEVRICMGEACQSVGARALLSSVEAGMTDDVDVQRVYCLGNCALGPSATVNGTLLGRVTWASIETAIQTERAS